MAAVTLINPLPSAHFPSFERRWAHLTGLFVSSPENSPRTLIGRVTWLKDVAVAALLCIPVVGHVLWYFPCVKFQVNTPVSHTPISPTKIPEVGLPNIGNTCWMNSVCQLVLRTPTFVRRIEELAASKNPPQIASLFHRLIIALKNNSQVLVIEALKAIHSFAKEVDEPDASGISDGGTFFSKVIENLRFDLTMERIFTPKDQKTKETHQDKESTLNRTACEDGQKTYLEVLATRKVDVAPNGTYDGTISKIPPVLSFRMTNELEKPRHWAQGEFPAIADFTNLFSPSACQDKRLRYRLVSFSVYHAGGSGHYTAQQINPRNHYNDRLVTQVRLDEVSRNLEKSMISIWELEDQSLVDPSYNLKTPS